MFFKIRTQLLTAFFTFHFSHFDPEYLISRLTVTGLSRVYCNRIFECTKDTIVYDLLIMLISASLDLVGYFFCGKCFPVYWFSRVQIYIFGVGRSCAAPQLDSIGPYGL
jgi:hypothetical protein